jgi:hypothetical protein
VTIRSRWVLPSALCVIGVTGLALFCGLTRGAQAHSDLRSVADEAGLRLRLSTAASALLADGPPPPPPPPRFITPQLIADYLVGLETLTEEEQTLANYNDTPGVDVGDLVSRVNQFHPKRVKQ